MGEATIQPASHATGHLANEPPGQRPKKKRQTATWIALASAATAIGAAVISGLQVNLAGKQNTEAGQAQLVSLTTIIAQQLTSIDAGTNQPVRASTGVGASTGLAASATRVQGYVAELTVEGQAGAVLIRDLNGNGVAAIEYIQVGRALEYSGDVAGAVTYYKDAISAPPHDAVTQAEALRFLGWAYYKLGQNVIARRDMMRATRTFSGRSLEPRDYQANIIAQGYLEDADWQIYLNDCRIAAADMAAVPRVMGPYNEDVVIQSFQTVDTNTYKSKCIGTAGRTP